MGERGSRRARWWALPRLGGAGSVQVAGWVAAFLLGVVMVAVLAPEPRRVVVAGSSGGGEGGGGRTLADDAATVPGGAGHAVGTGSASSDGGLANGSTPGRGSPTRNGSGVPVGAPGAAAPGVSATAITLGVGLPDLSAIGALGPGYDQGDPRQHVEGVLRQLRAEGRLPVHGRDIEPIYRSYNILSADAQRSVCEAFGIDHVVFAVMAISNFGAGNECTAREFQIPTFTSDGSTDAIHAASAPNLFTLQMTTDRLLRNFVAWAHRDGLLTGKRIGVYFSADPAAAKVVSDNVIKPIEALGHAVVAKVQTSDPATGGPTDAIAVQRFASDRVDTAILLVTALSKTNFFNQAESQGYRPRYLENDLASSTTDTATGTYPKDQFDGTPAFTGLRFGELNSGLPEPAESQWCRAAIRRHTQRDIPRRGRDAEYIAANRACDEILTILHGLEQAGPALTRAGFIGGVETIRNRSAGIHGNLTFRPGRHDGTSSWRRIDWSKACSCWKVSSEITPLLVD